MTHHTKPSDHRSHFFRQRSVLLSISCLTSFGLLSSGLVRANETQAPTDDFLAPASVELETTPETWEPEPYIPPPAPTYLEPTDDYYSPPAAEALAPEPAPVDIEPIHQDYSAPAAEYWEPEPIAPPPAPMAFPANSEQAEGPENNYIDPTEYKIGATDSYEPPSTVVFSERSTGCEASANAGEIPSSWCIAPPPMTATYPGSPSEENPGYHPAPGSGYVAQPGTGSYKNIAGNPSDGYYNSPAAYSANDSSGSYSYSDNSGSGVYTQSAAITPIEITSMSTSGLAYYNRTQRPRKMIGNNDTHLLFPLNVPAAITSLFGWRQHPILGTGKFHTGIDFGVDEGVPVVAAYSGQVAIADWLGGYGLTVVLQHATKSKETLYAHLSEVFVKPGEWVEQGEVVGRVGSTGMSTGPHLHFELRELTAQGWITVDPGKHIEYATAQLLKVLQMTKVPEPPKLSPEQLAKQAKDLEGKPQLIPAPPGIEITITNLEPPPLNPDKVAQTPKETDPETPTE